MTSNATSSQHIIESNNVKKICISKTKKADMSETTKETINMLFKAALAQGNLISSAEYMRNSEAIQSILDKMETAHDAVLDNNIAELNDLMCKQEYYSKKEAFATGLLMGMRINDLKKQA